MSSTASSFFGRPSVAHYQPGASSSSESISGHGADALKRRHTIGDDARIQGGAIRSSRSRTSRPTSPYNSSDRRRASPHASGFSGTSGGADSNFPSDRTLAHLPGLASQSESQLPTRSYPGPVSSYQEHRPTSRKRPTTSPTTSIQQAYPPSSFPRRLSASTSSLSGPSHVPPYTAAPSSYAMGGPSSYAGSAYGPPSGSAPYDHRGGPPQAYEQGRHRLYSASEVIGHFQVPFTEEVQPSSSGTGTGGERHKYECPFCYKGFNRPSSLKIHVNTHTGEKLPGCERRFSVMSNMRRHARTHDQARFMGDAVEVEDVEDDRESPTIEPRKRGGAASSPTSPHGLSSPAAGPSQPIESPSSPSRPGRGAASTGVGRLRSPRTTRSRATRRSLPGQSQEPSMETIGLLRPASPTPTPPLASPQSPHHREDLVQRLILPVAPSLNLAATAHQLYEEAQQAHPPMVPPEIVAGPSTATRTSPRGKRAVSPDSAENPKGHKRSKSSPELDIGHLSRRGGKGNKRGSGGSPTSKKS
ncbi:hypothetical protein FRB98_006231 [Tulasnella sp. 332]|nr:hypothetical protein FRB98_006231 [Tulasnella sp. 332]